MLENRALKSRLAGIIPALLQLAFADPALSQNSGPWEGVHSGVDIGTAASHGCSHWTLIDSQAAPGAAPDIDNRNCPGRQTFMGGIELGENFQAKRLVWGLDADLDLGAGGGTSSMSQRTSDRLAPGTYGFSGRLSPSNILMVGPQIGYGGDEWHPYIRAGGVFAFGDRANTISYIAPGASKAAASFGGGQNFSSTGWMAGGGIELGLYGPWSLTVEYRRLFLGGRTKYAASCAGSVAGCAVFSDISLISTHDGFSTDLISLGINYSFDYW